MRKATFGFVFSLIAPAWLMADDAALSLADLEAYRLALSAHPASSAPLVRFRDLWDHSETYVGRPVRVEGRIARLFRQPKIGGFPPLVEAWVVSPAGDPFCLVFPQQEGATLPQIGVSVAFSGTFLKRIKYHGADTDRLAPLIVGPVVPSGPTLPADRRASLVNERLADGRWGLAGCRSGAGESAPLASRTVSSGDRPTPNLS